MLFESWIVLFSLIVAEKEIIHWRPHDFDLVRRRTNLGNLSCLTREFHWIMVFHLLSISYLRFLDTHKMQRRWFIQKIVAQINLWFSYGCSVSLKVWKPSLEETNKSKWTTTFLWLKSHLLIRLVIYWLIIIKLICFLQSQKRSSDINRNTKMSDTPMLAIQKNSTKLSALAQGIGWC